MNMERISNIGLIGYGEVGKIFSAGLKGQPGVRGISAWDLKFADAGHAGGRAGPRGAGRRHGAARRCRRCARRAISIISAVTASNTLAVAQEAARIIRPGTIFLDLNSASPGTKQQRAALIDAAGAHYVEAGVMTSVPPYGIKVPMLLGGAQGGRTGGRARRLGHGRQGRVATSSAWPAPSRCAAAS